jgi:hypothetical protein
LYGVAVAHRQPNIHHPSAPRAPHPRPRSHHTSTAASSLRTAGSTQQSAGFGERRRGVRVAMHTGGDGGRRVDATACPSLLLVDQRALYRCTCGRRYDSSHDAAQASTLPRVSTRELPHDIRLRPTVRRAPSLVVETAGGPRRRWSGSTCNSGIITAPLPAISSVNAAALRIVRE